MQLPSADQMPAGTPVWLAILITLGPMILTLSKSAGKLPGILGEASRRWHGRQLAEIERSKNLDVAMRAEVARRVREEMAPLQEQIDRLQRELEAEREARQEIDRENQQLQDYTVYVARRIFERREWAAATGITLPPPPLMPFRDWQGSDEK